MHDFLENTFRLSESHTTIRTEILAGVTTFMTMSYIIFVQPAVLSTTGMDFQAVLASTYRQRDWLLFDGTARELSDCRRARHGAQLFLRIHGRGDDALHVAGRPRRGVY